MLRPSIAIFFLLFLSATVRSQESIEDLSARIESVRQQIAAASTDEERGTFGLELEKLVSRVAAHPDVLSPTTNSIPITSVVPDDGSFRLFTWNIPSNDGSNRFFGIMALKTRKGSTVIEFRDSTEVLSGSESRELFPGKWYGALYYDVITTKRAGKKYYTLLGWKGYSRTETQKVLEVLRISGGRVSLGAPLFSDSPHDRKNLYRKVYRYSFQAKMNLQKDRENSRIILDHLAPSRPDLDGNFAFYGPDLSYDQYVWDGRQWVLEQDVDVKGNPGDKRLWNKPDTPDPNKVK